MFRADLGSALLDAARRHAERPALWVAGRRLTYAELFGTALRIAGSLDRAGVAVGERVAILSQRSPTAHAGILGALLAGCTYVPLNPRFPKVRNQAMLLASEAAALVVDAPSAAGLPELLDPLGPDLVVVQPEANDARQDLGGRTVRLADGATLESPGTARRGADRDQPAYLLFTSGTTGTPKGVPISHANVSAYLSGVSGIGAIRDDDRVLQVVELTFDLSVHDMFLAWLAGAELYSLPDNAGALTARYIAQHRITSCLLVPSTAAFALERRLARPGAMPSLRLSYFCGEGLPRTVAAGWQEAAPNSRVINLYGPTEATVAFSAFEFRPDEAAEFPVVPIGRPLGAQRMALFTPDMAEAGPGEYGQICLSGSQVAAGYWRNPAADAEKFAVVDGRRWYRTGDLGRVVEPYGVVFAGRADRQVKVRGYLIELQEVEGAIRRVTGRQQVAVIPWPAAADGIVEGLAAFVCGENADVKELQASCRALVGDYMTPGRVLFVSELPVNSNGKVDYNVLARHPGLAA